MQPMTKNTEFVRERESTILDDLASVYSGDPETFDASAVRVAEYLDAYLASVREWATNGGSHGGNPYAHGHVWRANRLYEIRIERETN